MRAPFVLSLCVSLMGCDRSLTNDVHDNALFRDRITAAVPRGMDTGQARRLMAQEGFRCAFHRGTDVDTLEKDVETPSDRLTCVKYVEARPETADGYRRYVVDILAPGAHVESVETRMWMDRRP
jgi:hypothetical protein